MRRIRLSEFEVQSAVPLDGSERDALLALGPSVQVSPTAGRPNHFDLRAGSHVGLVALPELELEIHPKISVSRLMFLLSYAANPRHWLAGDLEAAEEAGVLEAVALGYCEMVRRAVSRGVLQGYRSREDSLLCVRGRIRIDAQLRKHFGRSPPAEVIYDEFTEDTDLNRVLRAALDRLGRMPIRSRLVRKRLRAVERLFANVCLVPIDLRRPPEICWSRLNDRFRGVVELGIRILRGFSFELGGGGAKATAFLLNMNRVFEDFVVVALREALSLTSSVLVQGAHRRQLFLDHERGVKLEPDITWWEGQKCLAVADVKYKRIQTGEVKHGDLYQLLAYAVATGLPRGTLIYAKGVDEPSRHSVVEIGKKLEIVALDLSVPPAEILGQVDVLAGRFCPIPG